MRLSFGKQGDLHQGSRPRIRLPVALLEDEQARRALQAVRQGALQVSLHLLNTVGLCAVVADQAHKQQLAKRAVDEVWAIIRRKGAAPQRALRAVADYQATVDWPKTPGRREADGIWGSTTRTAAARDLQVSESSLPPTAWD